MYLFSFFFLSPNFSLLLLNDLNELCYIYFAISTTIKSIDVLEYTVQNSSKYFKENVGRSFVRKNTERNELITMAMQQVLIICS